MKALVLGSTECPGTMLPHALSIRSNMTPALARRPVMAAAAQSEKA